jgi:hypothetical protein
MTSDFNSNNNVKHGGAFGANGLGNSIDKKRASTAYFGTEDSRMS